MKTTPQNITSLESNQVFVFGSNLNGNHAGGAARIAVEKFGAKEGQAIGLQGQSYAIPTLDTDMEKIAYSELKNHADAFLCFVKNNPDKEFLVTPIGTGIAGWAIEPIASLFVESWDFDNLSLPAEFQEIKGYKGFDKNMKCRDFQYEEGKEYVHNGKVEACDSGFHYCEHPLNTFDYYSPGQSTYHEVVGRGFASKERDGDTKVAVSHIKVGLKLSFSSLTEAAIKFVFDRAKWSKSDRATGRYGAASATGYQGAASATGYQGAASATGDQGAASATGDQGAASATGDQGAASATGDQGAASATGYQGAASATGRYGAASATGDQGAASATGYQGAASATGYQGAASATGYQGAASATGYQGAASATGDQGAASATGDQGAASATGDQGAAVALGIEGKAMADINGFITVAEWKYFDEDGWKRIDVQSTKVDGENIKANTWYKLVDGQFVEA